MSFMRRLLVISTLIIGLFPNHPSSAIETSSYKIAFNAPQGLVRGNPYHIFVMNPDGTGKKQITHGPFSCLCPTWSPDGRRIAFTSSKAGASDIFVINLDGTGERNLTNTPDVYEYHPDWSPDGEKIAFDVAARAEEERGIWVLDLRSGERRRITDGCGPVWSPDGSRIAFIAPGNGGKSDIFICDEDGGGRINLTDHPGRDLDPSFTPDGRSIVFVSSRLGWGGYDLFLLDVETRRVKQVTKLAHLGLSARCPDVSPDGRWIIFIAGKVGVDDPLNIYVVDITGKSLRRLTESPFSEFKPCWSPVPIGMGMKPSNKLLTLWGMLKMGLLNPKGGR